MPTARDAPPPPKHARPALAAVLRNPASHRNRRSRVIAPAPPGVLIAEPSGREALGEALRRFAERGVTRLVIDGGDGTIREVLSQAPEAFAGRPLEIALLPTGKTNVLARDLGVPAGWSLAEALASPRTALRTPLEIRRPNADQSVQRGFIFGAGAFLEATQLAQRAHRARMFDGIAVGAALAGAGVRTLLGHPSNAWNTGVPLRLQLDDEPEHRGAAFLLLVSTLQRLPLKLKPFGPPCSGLKVLHVDAPPRRLREALPVILSGRDTPWLAAAGYRRSEPDWLVVGLQTPYVLDGETYDGGDLLLMRGAPIAFVVP